MWPREVFDIMEDKKLLLKKVAEEDPDHVDEVEGILIASMTTANRAVPRIKEISLPSELGKILRLARRAKFSRLPARPILS
jgi:hypothetical protein